MKKQAVPVEEPVRYIITFYNLGATPLHAWFTDLAEAEAKFAEMVADPFAGAVSLNAQQTLMRPRHV